MNECESRPELIIHHIEGRRSLRVIWTCEELQVPYRLVYEQGNILASLIQIRKSYPLMPVSPVVVIDGQFMVESGAIIEALAARYGDGRLVPSIESPDYLHHLQWLHFAEASMMFRGLQSTMLSMATGIPVNAFPPGYRSGIDPPDAVKTIGYEQCFSFADNFLSGKAYFSGDEFGLADIAMHLSIRFGKLMGDVNANDYKHITSWRDRVESRPAYSKALIAACPRGANEYLQPKDLRMAFKAAEPLGMGGKTIAWFLLKISERTAKKMRKNV